MCVKDYGVWQLNKCTVLFNICAYANTVSGIGVAEWSGAATSCRRVQIKCNKWPNFTFVIFVGVSTVITYPGGKSNCYGTDHLCTACDVIWSTQLLISVSHTHTPTCPCTHILLSPMFLITGFIWHMQFFRYSRTSIFWGELPKCLDHTDYTNLEYMISHFFTYVVWYKNCIIKCYVRI